MLGEELKQQLRKLANESIDYGLAFGAVMPIDLSDDSEALQAQAATFVTLEINHQLRGCIGTLQAHQPLAQDVVEHAFAAAFKDPRFSPLTKAERSLLRIKISILSTPEAMSFASEEALLNQLRPSIDGLILEKEGRQATFLPSVWASLTDKKDFLSQLKLKAGMTTNHWSDKIKAYRYTVEEI